jgi:hypothetical protein
MMRWFLLSVAAGILVLAMGGTAKADHSWHRPRGHYDYHPGHFVPHRGHYHYVPPHYDYHRGRHHHSGHGHGYAVPRSSYGSRYYPAPGYVVPGRSFYRPAPYDF